MSNVEALSIAELIPHAGESILLDRVITHNAESTTARVIVGNKRWLTQRDGSVAPWLAIEYMAQCVAAHESMLARADGRILPLGFLVRVVRLRLGASRFRGGELLRVSAQRIRGRPGLGILSHDCTIFAESDGPEAEPVAAGRLLIVVKRTDG
jgi:predicted hotdog family 3-hydroxylacyl-ACP dehydratase